MKTVKVLVDDEWYDGKVISEKFETYGLLNKKKRVKYLIQYFWRSYSFITHSRQNYNGLTEAYEKDIYFIENQFKEHEVIV